MPSPLDKIKDLEQQIVALREAAVNELHQKRQELQDQLAEVNAEIERITGEKTKGPRKARAKSEKPPSGSKLNPPLTELKEILSAQPDKTLNIRKGNYDLRNIKVLAEANPGLLKLGGQGAWPTVTLLK